MGEKRGREATNQKPCLCQVRPLRRAVMTRAGNVNAQGQREFKCRLCGATEWR